MFLGTTLQAAKGPTYVAFGTNRYASGQTSIGALLLLERTIMDVREQHINRAYNLRGECCRNGCRRVATSRIHFFSYRTDGNERNATYACADHAEWWTVGVDLITLGTLTRLKGMT